MRNRYGISALVFAATSVLPLVGCGSSGSNGDTPAANISYTAPSGAANNIMFTFDKPYPRGQFANGDWWVAPLTTGGTVTITSITPAASGGVNGFMVNPTSTASQGWDSRSNTKYNSSLMPSLPLAINTTTTPVSSVVKMVSLPVEVSHTKAAFAAVLTVVNAPISNSNTLFRPGYFGTTGKTSYIVPSVLPSQVGYYSVDGSVPSMSSLTFSSIAATYQNVWLDFGGCWCSRDLHPADNMPDYGEDIANANSNNLLRMLLSDFRYTNPTHKQALINYLQMTIDLKSVAANGGSWGGGSHGNGRKLPLQFANMVFGGTDFSNAITASAFTEDQDVYRSSVTGEVLWGTASTEAGYWEITIGAEAGNPAPSGSKTVADYYGRIDGGGYLIGNTSAGYQVAVNSMPFKYIVLGRYMLGLVTPPTFLPNPATNSLVEYVERWVNYGVKAADTITSINLTTHVITSTPQGLPVCARPLYPSSAVYGVNYGPNGSGGCIVGTNNWTSMDNTSVNAGGYGSTFGNQLWAWYRP